MDKQELRRGGGRKRFWAERRLYGKIMRQEGGLGKAIVSKAERLRDGKGGVQDLVCEAGQARPC